MIKIFNKILVIVTLCLFITVGVISMVILEITNNNKQKNE